MNIFKHLRRRLEMDGGAYNKIQHQEQILLWLQRKHQALIGDRPGPIRAP